MTYIQEDEQQYGRDLQETAEAFLYAQHRAEVAAWNVLEGLNELNRIEAEHTMNLSLAIRELIEAIDKARETLRSV